jgi:hypothetical protein
MGRILSHFLQPEESTVIQGNLFQEVTPQKYLQAFLVSINAATCPMHCSPPYFNNIKIDEREYTEFNFTYI